jgi:integrase
MQDEGSAKTFLLADDLIARLKVRKQASHFSGASDWVFASPFSIGRLPYSYTCTRLEMARASVAAGIGHLTTHAFRHYAEFRTMPSTAARSASRACLQISDSA